MTESAITGNVAAAKVAPKLAAIVVSKKSRLSMLSAFNFEPLSLGRGKAAAPQTVLTYGKALPTPPAA
jgi:hypothetical protein